MFFFIGRELGRIDDDTSLTATQRDIHCGTFPGHPHGEGTYRIDCFVRMEANTTFVRTTRVIMLDTETGENLQRTIIHAYRNTESKLTGRPPKDIPHTRVKFHCFSNGIELFLGNLE